MASASDTRVEIRKFDDKNFVLWKEMMQDVLIIRHQIEAIWHNNTPVPMAHDEWHSLDEIARLNTWMHLTENVNFIMAKEKMAFTLWEKL